MNLAQNIRFRELSAEVLMLLRVFIEGLHLLQHLICNFVQRGHLERCDCNLDVVQTPYNWLEF